MKPGEARRGRGGYGLCQRVGIRGMTIATSKNVRVFGVFPRIGHFRTLRNAPSSSDVIRRHTSAYEMLIP